MVVRSQIIMSKVYNKKKRERAIQNAQQPSPISRVTALQKVKRGKLEDVTRKVHVVMPLNSTLGFPAKKRACVQEEDTNDASVQMTDC
mmetsp:Transcript_47058/g.84268  ORF Transcript_47058/g.84268 Transcript_47058/m.84268 type:complete len:88 (-) Transcript_47058:241-504(-)